MGGGSPLQCAVGMGRLVHQMCGPQPWDKSNPGEKYVNWRACGWGKLNAMDYIPKEMAGYISKNEIIRKLLLGY